MEPGKTSPPLRCCIELPRVSSLYEISLRRKHFLLSYFRTLGVGPDEFVTTIYCAVVSEIINIHAKYADGCMKR